MALLLTDRPMHTVPAADVRYPVVPTPRTPQDNPTFLDGATPAPGAPRAAAARRSPVRRGVIGAVVTTVLTLGVGATSVAVTVQENSARAEAVRVASAEAAAAEASDLDFLRTADGVVARGARVAHAEQLAARAAAVARAVPHVEAARATLGANPQASVESRIALQSAIDVAAALTVANPVPFIGPMDDAVAALLAPQQAVAESQTAWQASEDARIAAEAEAQARAAARAAQPVRQARAPQEASRSARSAAPAARASAPSASQAPAAAPAAPAEVSSSVPEFSAGAIGAAINDHRAANGLPALSVSRSGTLYAHAAAMAEAGTIWHGGSDKIVGFVRPGSASSLVRAWANSPAHNAWMLRDGVSSMQIGAAELGGRLYGAVDFR